MLRFIESKDVLVNAARVLAPASAFLQVEGASSANITVDGGDLTKAAKPLNFANGATNNSARLRGQ
jgi:hypothetical protein